MFYFRKQLKTATFTFIFIIPFTTISQDAAETGIVTDIDGNAYRTVKIGSTLWMAENLGVSRYRNGDAIPTAAGNSEWEAFITGAWSNYNNDPVLGKTYGKLYNWYAVSDPRGLCPEGWHIPADAEFQSLAAYLGGDTIAGEKLKSDSLGFAAMAAGYRFFNGKYNHLGNFTGFWSSSEASSAFAWIHLLHFKKDPQLYRKFFGKKNGFSCRCVKD